MMEGMRNGFRKPKGPSFLQDEATSPRSPPPLHLDPAEGNTGSQSGGLGL